MFIFPVHLFAEEAVDVNLIAVSGTPPVLTLDPNAIEDDLNTGEISEHEIIVANEGEAELRVAIEAEIIAEPERDAAERRVRRVDGEEAGPRRDDLGDVIAHFGWQDAPMNRYKAGIAWDHDQEMMWVTTYSPNQIGLIDPSNDYEEVMSFQPQGTNPMGAAWREGGLYTVPWANQFLSSWDAEGNALGNINFPTRPTAVSYSTEGEFFVIITDVGGWRFMFFAFDGENLEEIGSHAFQAFNGRWPRSVLWVDLHPD